MDKNLDIKLYNEYLKGEKEAFELLYSKYKSKIQYFIFNIIKDQQKAEDLTQEVFIYVLQNQKKSDCSFKYYIYMVAKSKALSYVNTRKRRIRINEQYFSEESEKIEQDVIEVIIRKETQKELLEAINMLDDKYKNAIYLVKIEEMSYKEVAEILGESIQNIKNLVYRGKKELRKILLKKGYDEMNKISKIIVIVICATVLFSGIVYATYRIYERANSKENITPIFTSKLSDIDTNKVWIGTFNLVWNDFMNEVIKGPIEFEDGESELAKELNKQIFTTKQLSENSYYKMHGQSTFELKNIIERDIRNKFNEESKIIDKVEWGNPNSYVLYAILKKEFNYLEPFPTLADAKFGNSEERVKYFGIKPYTDREASKNVEILFYNSKDECAIKLKTKEGEEVLLYKTTGEGKSFEENYNEMKKKQYEYKGKRTLGEKDTLEIPYIKIKDEINYDELCGRYIKGTDWYIRQALQTVDFELNNYGGSVKSEALIEAMKNSESEIERVFSFNEDFILYLKEESKEKPYFALKVDNTDVLVSNKNE